MKAFTDLEQSKKLAEILPLESADMYLWSSGKRYYIEAMDDGDFNEEEGHVRAWSLAALIDIIENIGKPQKVEISFTHNGGKYWVDVHFDEFGSFCQDYELYDSKVDALVAMIEKFKNRNLL